jgi:serine/threonine-protein kinase
LSLGITVGIGMAAALDHVHRLTAVDGAPLEVVHRDVSPHNILMAHDGSPKLIDFGIVRTSVQTHQTQAGVVKGKFAYIAPEILVHGKIDQRADVFALGVVIHELLTGKPLFRGHNEAETMELTKRALVPPLDAYRDDVPAGIERCIRTALESDPNRRFHSADAMRRALASAARDARLYCDSDTVRTEVESICGPAPTPIYRDSLYYPDVAMVPGRRARGSESDATGSNVDAQLSYFLGKAGVPMAGPRTSFGRDT